MMLLRVAYGVAGSRSPSASQAVSSSCRGNHQALPQPRQCSPPTCHSHSLTGWCIYYCSICKHSLFAPLEPGTEAVVVRVSHRHEDFLYDLEWQVPDSGPARVWYLPSSHLSRCDMDN